MNTTNNYYIYILASCSNKAIYIGVTNNLVRRVYEHKRGLVDGFTKEYRIHKLVYFEMTNDVNSAIEREKQLKKLHRYNKNKLINAYNPEWLDLYDDIC